MNYPILIFSVPSSEHAKTEPDWARTRYKMEAESEAKAVNKALERFRKKYLGMTAIFAVVGSSKNRYPELEESSRFYSSTGKRIACKREGDSLIVGSRRFLLAGLPGHLPP